MLIDEIKAAIANDADAVDDAPAPVAELATVVRLPAYETLDLIVQGAVFEQRDDAVAVQFDDGRRGYFDTAQAAYAYFVEHGATYEN